MNKKTYAKKAGKPLSGKEEELEKLEEENICLTTENAYLNN